jgi:glycosyltransferase involved in cell wall biosynthesis
LNDDFKLSVLMPVFNEREFVAEIIDRVRAVDLAKEIVVVDDGSSDGTRELLKGQVEGRFPDVKVVYHERNRGKGAAVRTAIAHASGSVCVIQDADLETDPREYQLLLEPILNGRADVVFGSRFVGGRPHRVNTYVHYLANKLLTTFCNVLTNLHLTDMETCYKLARTPLLKSLRLRANRFDIEPELTIKLAATGARFYEIPISYSPRDRAQGKKIGWVDGLQTLWAIVRFRFFD